MASRDPFKNQMERTGKLLELISSHNSFFSNMGYSNICPVCCCPGSVQNPGLLVSEGRPGEYSAGSPSPSHSLHRPVSFESIPMQTSSYILSSAVGPPLSPNPKEILPRVATETDPFSPFWQLNASVPGDSVIRVSSVTLPQHVIILHSFKNWMLKGSFLFLKLLWEEMRVTLLIFTESMNSAKGLQLCFPTSFQQEYPKNLLCILHCKKSSGK